MRVSYEDEYENTIHFAFDAVPPNVDEIVILAQEEWKVQSRIFYPEQNAVAVVLTQHTKRGGQHSVLEGRLDKMQAAILEANKRHEKLDKKTRTLREQMYNVRQQLRTKNNVRS